MKRSVLSTFLVLAVATLALAMTSRDTQTLRGEYEWSRGGDAGTLEALFAPAGEGRWSVTFQFDFRGASHVYSGTAEGSLTDGSLVGRVENDDKRRSFSFSGTFEDGVFRGRHAETTAGREVETGTLLLRI